MKNTQTYDLSLADGQRWKLIPEDNVDTWLDKMSSIMQLDKNTGKNHCLKIYFRYTKKQKDYINLIYAFLRKKNAKIHQLWPVNDQPYIDRIKNKAANELCYLTMRKALYPIYIKTLALKGLPMHAALIKYRNKGFLLAGPASYGKSTCCERLRYPWQVLCDDEALIAYDGKKYVSHPFPTWSNHYFNKSKKRSWNVQASVPLKGIFFLQKNKIDRIIPIPRHQAVIYICQLAGQVLSVSRNNISTNETMVARKMIFNNACEFLKHVPAYILHVDLNGKFWEEIEKVI